MSEPGVTLLTLDNPSGCSFSGDVTDDVSGGHPAVRIIKTGAGVFEPYGTCTINTSGGLEIDAGAVQLGPHFNSAFALTMNGGMLDLNGNDQFLSQLDGTAGTITDDSADQARDA